MGSLLCEVDAPFELDPFACEVVALVFVCLFLLVATGGWIGAAC
jgi:hypothetical protein